MGEVSGGADYSLRIVWAPARWVEEVKGRDAFMRLCARAEVAHSDFDATTRWVSHAQMETILSETRRLAGDDETFRDALLFRFEQSLGAFRHMVWAVSVESMALKACEMGNVLARDSSWDVLSSSPTGISFRYHSKFKESDLLCQSRRESWSRMTTLHGLPPADVRHPKCIARGDDCCEYHVTWMPKRSLRSVLLGAGVGAVAAALAHLVDPGIVGALALPLLGASAGYVHDLRRLAKHSATKAEDLGGALRSVGASEAETRGELCALQQRQSAWNVRMEEEHDAQLERIVAGLEGMQRSRVTSLRGFSHDLRNPLFVARANAKLLREHITDGEDAEILDDIESATEQIETMLGRLVDVCTAETGLAKLHPEEMPVAQLGENLKRRLRALVFGRAIDVTVVTEENAPESIVVDRLVFDRVVDNLLTNAAKYTDQGNIRLVLRAPRLDESALGCGLVLEVADTGRGIPKEKIAEILRPRATGMPRTKESWGVGLSSAIRLLNQIGGRLEVTSEVDIGSTFRARFPGRPPAQKGAAEEDLDGIIASVVKVRSASESA